MSPPGEEARGRTEDKDDAELRAIADAVIDANRFMALGTAGRDGLPWVSPVWYAPVGKREFFWVSDPAASHSQNLAERPDVAITIYDSHEPGGRKSVYVAARAEQLEGAERERGIEVFSQRSQAQGLAKWGLDDVEPPARHRLYRATASELWVLGPDDRRRPIDPA